MLKVGQIETVEITGYTSEGLGVCRIDGCAVFVPNAIRGEVCEVAVSYVSRNSAQAKIRKLLRVSPHRVNRLCPDAKRCGGCQLHHMDYAEELYFKAQKVTDALNRLGGQALDLVPITGGDGVRVEAPVSLPLEGKGDREAVDEVSSPPENTASLYNSQILPLNSQFPTACLCYRNKAQYPVQMQNGRIAAGFYRQKTHEVVPIARCAILPPEFDVARDAVVRWAEENRVSVYDEATGKGLLRHIYVRKGFATGQLMVCVVAAGKRLPRTDRLIAGLQQSVPGLASVVLAVNSKPGNAVLGDEFHTLFGAGEIEDVLCGFRFRLSPRSFYQVNRAQAERLYEKAVAFADLQPNETVLDLYCGTGTITLALSRAAGKAVGVEIIPQAIADAKENARRNGVENVEFYCADASEAARRFAAAPLSPVNAGTSSACPLTPANPAGAAPLSPVNAGTGSACPPSPDADLPPANCIRSECLTGNACPYSSPEGSHPDCIVVDPPRKGLSPDVIEAIAQMSPSRVVYVSCDPATLARDVKLLTARGYDLKAVEAVDMFPRTFHVETVVSLSQLKSEV